MELLKLQVLDQVLLSKILPVETPQIIGIMVVGFVLDVIHRYQREIFLKVALSVEFQVVK